MGGGFFYICIRDLVDDSLYTVEEVLSWYENLYMPINFKSRLSLGL